MGALCASKPKAKTNPEPPVKIYMSHFSPPSRAVLSFVALTNIPHQIIEIELPNGTQKPEYKEIHPFQKVPAIDDGGFKLFESQAILRYLAKTRKVPDNWVPADPKKLAIVESYLNWHPTGAKVIPFFILAGKLELFGRDYKTLDADKVTKEFNDYASAMETFWLKDGKFIGGLDQISIADVIAFCMLEQLIIARYEVPNCPKIEAYRKKLREMDGFKAGHKGLLEKLAAFAGQASGQETKK